MPQRLNQTGPEFHFLLAFIMFSVLSVFLNAGVEGMFQPKMKILSSFTHYRVFPNWYDFLSSIFLNGH